MILYLGNILSHLGKSVSVIESLGPRLAEFDQVVMASRKANRLFRLIDMLLHVFWYRRARILLIDCYSSTAFWYVVLTSAVARSIKMPYVPILHGGDLPGRLQSSPWLSRFVFANAHTNVSPSLFLKERFSHAGFRVVYIPNFIEKEKYVFRKRTGLRPRLLWVRAFHKIYNPLLAVDILKSLSTKYPDVSLTMVGSDKDGSVDEVRSKAQRDGVDHLLEIAGYLSKEEWRRRSESFDIFINTTDFDNMPVSVVEAMALGLVVVSTNAGGLPYLIHHQEDGLLVNTGDLHGFTCAIETLVNQPEWAEKLATRARLKAEGFDWQVVKKQWMDVCSA